MNAVNDLYVLNSTFDTADRSADIEKMLDEKGVCVLGHGVFYVSGVTMPDHTTLMGLGECSQLILAEEIEEGYAVKLGSRCCIKNLAIKGALEDIERPTELGKRHGIGFLGTATTNDWSGQSRNCIVDACQIRSFTGGGITCTDTGYSVGCSITATNCHINYCGIGINISHFSEFHRFTNMYCCHNFFGCVNNGGNNVFVNCVFDSNTTGYIIDNADGNANNNSHGSVVGCTFNHSGYNKGIGIAIINAKNGYVFTGCQMFYSKIVVDGSSAIQFNDFNFGKNQEITIKGGKMVLFSNCLFSKQPTVILEDEPCVRCHHCYTWDGEDVLIGEGV